MTEVSLGYEKQGGTYKLKDVTKVPVQPLKAGSHWGSQKITFVTNLFGKDYYWMRDTDGTDYLAKIGPDGNPVFA
jgi:hypothetical protein